MLLYIFYYTLTLKLLIGPSGLAAIKQCLDDKLDVICFEKNPHIGGLWKYVEINGDEDPHSSVYKSVIINTCKEIVRKKI